MAKEKFRPNIDESMGMIADTYRKCIADVRKFYEQATSKELRVQVGEDLRRVAEMQQEEINAKIKEKVTAAETQATRIIEQYKKSEDEFFKLDGSFLTSDHELLNEKAGITAEQLRDIAARYLNNYTMFNACQQYAARAGLPFNIRLQPSKTRVELLESFNKLVGEVFRSYTIEIADKGVKFDFEKMAEVRRANTLKEIWGPSV